MENESGKGTTVEAKSSILSDLWLNYRAEEEFGDFIAYNDLALPLAFAIDSNLIEPNPKIVKFINEAWDLLLAGLEIEDTGFETLDEMLQAE